MTLNPSSFDNVQVLRTPPANNQQLLRATGVAVINFSTDSPTMINDDLVFVVPREGEDTPVESGGQALEVGQLLDSAVNVFVATAHSNIGWGVDTANSVTTDGKTAQVTARLALADGVITRVGFQISILASTTA